MPKNRKNVDKAEVKRLTADEGTSDKTKASKKGTEKSFENFCISQGKPSIENLYQNDDKETLSDPKAVHFFNELSLKAILNEQPLVEYS